MHTDNLFQVINNYLKFGTKSRFKGLAAVYITVTILIGFLFLCIFILSEIEKTTSKNTYDFYFNLAVTLFLVVIFTEIYKLAKKLDMHNTKVILVFFSYINLCLALIPSNIENIYKHIKR